LKIEDLSKATPEQWDKIYDNIAETAATTAAPTKVELARSFGKTLSQFWTQPNISAF
jgi:hypothetical protein